MRAALPFMDPPDHTPLRKILLKILAPAAMKRMQSVTDGWAERLVDYAISRGSVDLVQDIVRPFTVNVMADAVGLPKEGRDHLVTLGNVTLASVGVLDERYTEAVAAAVKTDTFSWMAEVCRRENLAPGGIGQDIFAAADRGEIDEGIAEELVSLFVNGGVDTTFTTISKGFKNFLDNPEQWELLIGDPSLAMKAFDEVMRFNVSVQQAYRVATRDVELEGYLIPKGARIGVAIAGAGRDPTKFADPDRFDITRSTMGHLGFGSGIHSCAGQAVARMEGDSLYRAFAARGCRFKLNDEPQIWVLGGMGSWKHLPVDVICGGANGE
jgi:cytochrome P450